MNDILEIMRETIEQAEYDDMNYGDAQAIRRNTNRLMLETCCRMVLALVIDEVTRMDNVECGYLNVNDRDVCLQKLKVFFSYDASSHSLGSYLNMADQLLQYFRPEVMPDRKLPRHILYIYDMLKRVGDLLPTRNVGSHVVEDRYVVANLDEKLRTMLTGDEVNPYFDSRCVTLLTMPQQDFSAGRAEYELRAMQNGKRIKRVYMTANQVLRGKADPVMEPIALNSRAVYMEVRLPGEPPRLHLLSPLLTVTPADRSIWDFCVYYKRHDEMLQSSLYINVTAPAAYEIISDYDDTDQMLKISLEQRLRSMEWKSELFAPRSSSRSRMGEWFRRRTAMDNYSYFINVGRAAKHDTYTELWNAVYEEKDFFDVPMYGEETLRNLRGMFTKEAPASNPMYVCGRGGVGKTHTVIKVLREYLKSDEMFFKYIFFLTAKKTMFNAEAEGTSPAFQRREKADFQTCIEALRKILALVRNQKLEEITSRNKDYLIREIQATPEDMPVLLIIDDFDSVRSFSRKADSEAQRVADEKEQLELANALRQIARDSIRIIITTRNPLNQVGMTELAPLDEKQSLRFAEAYYRRRDEECMMPKQYRNMICKAGQGVPAFIMRIIYLLDHNTSYDLSDVDMRRLHSDIVNFSLNTTQLNPLGKEIFKSIILLSDVLPNIPRGMLRMIFFDASMDDITDAIAVAKRWEMITSGEVGDRDVRLRDDSMMLWDQVADDEVLTPRHRCVLDALMQDEAALSKYAMNVGRLLHGVCRRLESLSYRFDTAARRQFAIRVKELDREGNPFVAGLRASSEYDAVERFLNEWNKPAVQASEVRQTEKTGRKRPEPQKIQPQKPEPAKPIARIDAAEIYAMLDVLRRENWSGDLARKLLAAFDGADYSNEEIRLCCKSMLGELTQRTMRAHDDEGVNVEEFIDRIISIGETYKQQTGENDVVEIYADLL